MRSGPSGTGLARALLLGYLLVPAVLALTPDPSSSLFQDFYSVLARVVDQVTFGRAGVSLREAEALANVLLFIPLGALLPFALRGVPPSVLLLGAATASLAIETTQYLFLPGRVPSLLDVLLNGGGAAIGLVLASDLREQGR